jgi:DNA-binding XRE family transcriptional regulator
MENKTDETALDFDMRNLGNLIKCRRKACSFTQQELAERIGVSAQHYARIEKNLYTPSLKTFLKLAKVLDIQMENLKLKDIDVSPTMYEIMEILKSLNQSQQKAVLTFLESMTA